jgi:hypothetical protein
MEEGGLRVGGWWDTFYDNWYDHSLPGQVFFFFFFFLNPNLLSRYVIFDVYIPRIEYGKEVTSYVVCIFISFDR